MDEQDTQILARRQAQLDARTEAKAGDIIRFPDGTIKRMAHVWTDENGKAESIQPSSHDGDSCCYLGEGGYQSYSGGLLPGIDARKFTRTTETMEGSAWFFHHDYARAHNGIDVKVTLPVWDCEPIKNFWHPNDEDDTPDSSYATDEPEAYTDADPGL